MDKHVAKLRLILRRLGRDVYRGTEKADKARRFRRPGDIRRGPAAQTRSSTSRAVRAVFLAAYSAPSFPRPPAQALMSPV